MALFGRLVAAARRGLDLGVDPAGLGEGQIRRIRLVAIVSYATIFIGLPFVAQYWRLGVPWMSVAVVLTIVAGMVNVMWLRRHRDPIRAGAVGTSILFVLLLLSNIASGGFYDPNFGWLYVIPMLGALMVNARAGWVFTGLVLVVTIAFWAAGPLGVELVSVIPPELHAQQSLANRASAVIAIGVVLGAIASQQRFARRRLRAANDAVNEEMDRRAAMQTRLVHAERMASMGTLAAGVAHEINNPMTYVLTNLDLAREQLGMRSGHDSVLEMLDEALEGARRVRDLVRDLKTFSHHDEAATGPVDVCAVVERALKMTANEIRHRARIHRQFDVVPAAEGNEGRLFQVVVNVLTNAAHAIPEAAADANEIWVRTRLSGSGEIEIVVEDTGSGIPAELQDRIFEPFFTTKPLGRGTGLGLSICRNIVESMGGTIAIDSEVGRGTTVAIRLPCSSMRASGPVVHTDLSSVPGAVRRRILVVDDEPGILRAVEAALDGHEVVGCSDGQRALLQAARRPFDLVLCDVMMPNMSGAELYHALRKVAPALPVVMMTGGVFTERAAAFMEDHGGPLLQKPLDPETLRRTVGEHALVPMLESGPQRVSPTPRPQA